MTEISWLRLSNRPEEKISKTDEAKRRQLLAEFVYWLFDSFIIPLLNTNFYVTMSGADSNRLFYFRHDVWKKLSEPTLTRLKSTMFDALEPKKAQRILGSRKLGFVQIRLLPKDTGARPIMNLGKRGQLVGQTVHSGGIATC